MNTDYYQVFAAGFGASVAEGFALGMGIKHRQRALEFRQDGAYSRLANAPEGVRLDILVRPSLGLLLEMEVGATLSRPDSGPIGPGAASEPIQTVTTVALTVPMSTLAGDLVGGDLHRRAVPLRDVAVIAEAVGAWLRRELQQPLRLAGVLTLRAEGSD